MTIKILKETDEARFVSYLDWVFMENEGLWTKEEMKPWPKNNVPVAQYNGKALIAIGREEHYNNWL